MPSGLTYVTWFVQSTSGLIHGAVLEVKIPHNGLVGRLRAGSFRHFVSSACMNQIEHIEDLGLIDICPECGSDDLGHCGATEERTHLDITDVVECES